MRVTPRKTKYGVPKWLRMERDRLAAHVIMPDRLHSRHGKRCSLAGTSEAERIAREAELKRAAEQEGVQEQQELRRRMADLDQSHRAHIEKGTDTEWNPKEATRRNNQLQTRKRGETLSERRQTGRSAAWKHGGQDLSEGRCND